MRGDYYEDLKFCAGCDRYVQYLQAAERSYCVECGEEVSLFSADDMKAFRTSVHRSLSEYDAEYRDVPPPANRRTPA